ncbi:hypothetical protein NQ315_008675 [Exocentrus adspersus]|uniref:non-specific serine/threonine protein kinase n=1 Tax=Exocentrus adspersus TaxID=1586481 RepID=A0AAV8W6Q8_9CUCU|nr:hypothetical protein NQ315_008675 [Exocentrus adspersus]
MEGFELIKQGAEAKLYKGIYLGKPTLAKERFVKEYRHESLDSFLTKERMKAESRAIVRCKACGIRTPALYLVDFKRRIIFMEYFEHSITLKDFIESCSSPQVLESISFEVGKMLGAMHESNIMHGDLTSSNILLVNRDDVQKFDDVSELYLVFIDFGLAQFDGSAEDKGVDLYVLERALNSTHSVANKIFPKIIEGYRESYTVGCKEIFSKYEEVRARGRKRTMVG